MCESAIDTNSVLDSCQRYSWVAAVIGMTGIAGVGRTVLNSVRVMLPKDCIPGAQAQRSAIFYVVVVVAGSALQLPGEGRIWVWLVVGSRWVVFCIIKIDVVVCKIMTIRAG